MDIIILRLPQVQDRTGLSRSTIYALMKRGEFPQQISLGGRAVGWVREDVDNWATKCIERSRQYVRIDGDDNAD